MDIGPGKNCFAGSLMDEGSMEDFNRESASDVESARDSLKMLKE
jgi:hypothetical protein